jgi:hypothetical protein
MTMELQMREAQSATEAARDILLEQWDPFRFLWEEMHQQEYQGHVDRVLWMAARGASAGDIAFYLEETERDAMGVRRTPESRMKTAQQVLEALRG